MTNNHCLTCNLIKSSLLFPAKIIQKLYIFLFGRLAGQKFNDLIIGTALRARGYNNCCSMKKTGEYAFLKILALRNPKICLDIGANKGEYALEILKLTNSKIICFEPLPKAYQSLLAIKVKYGDRFDAVNLGVGSKNEILKLNYGSEDSELASFSNEINNIEYVGAHNTNQLDVKVITLDSFFENSFQMPYPEIDLIKIDTEGFEFDVLEGAQKTIAKYKPKFIQIEYNWHHLFRNHSIFSISQLLKEYKLFQILPYGKKLSPINPADQNSNFYNYSNFIFIRGDINLSE